MRIWSLFRSHMDSYRSIRRITELVAGHSNVNERERFGIETLFAAAKHIWEDESRPQLERLAAVNLLHEKAMEFLEV